MENKFLVGWFERPTKSKSGNGDPQKNEKG